MKRPEVSEYVATIEHLLLILPDEIDHEQCCWCWNELDDEQQEHVKKRRGEAAVVLKRERETRNDRVPGIGGGKTA